MIGYGQDAMGPAHSGNIGAQPRRVIAASSLARSLAAVLIVPIAGGTAMSGPNVLTHSCSQVSHASQYFGYWLDKLEQWRTAVAHHDPGTSDEAVATIGRWPRGDLLGVLAEIRVMAKSLHENPGRAVGSLEQRWLGLTGDEARHGDVSRLVKRGALLHTDIALLAPGLAPLAQYGSPRVIVTNDGLRSGEEDVTQWEFARRLLDSMDPPPSNDKMVRQWYLASTAWMESGRNWGTATPHLKRAREVFPSDAGILFYSGVLHEGYASAVTQNFLLTAAPRAQFDVGSEKSELQLARRFLEQAVAADPGFAEAWLRLGHVKGRLGDHDKALTDLMRASAAVTDPQLQYYAALFLGREQETLGHRDAAREQFLRASRLYPTAQSPLLALSHLASSEGDSHGALQIMEKALTLQVKGLAGNDPWWTYDVAHVRNAKALMAEMRRAFGELPQ